MRKQLVAVLVAPILAISTAQAAEAVRWDDLPKKMGDRKAHKYTIVTKEGARQKARQLLFSAKGVKFGGTEIPREEVAEIRIHHHLAMGEASGVPAFKVFSHVGESGIIFFPIMVPAFAALYAVTAPPALAVEGIWRMLPDKVIKVAP